MTASRHLTGLRADEAAAKRLIAAQRALDPDNEVALAMYGADLKRAQDAILQAQEAPELRVLRGIVRGEKKEATA